MEVDDIPQITPNVDYSSIQPIHQKRTIAFVNHFLLTTVSFLNDFASSCESRLMQFEYKLQKIEASLLILESQLSSIPDLHNVTTKPLEVDLPEVDLTETQNLQNDVNSNQTSTNTNTVTEENNNGINTIETETNGIKATADPRYSKFFKMLQFGVPMEAVKIKMNMEGIDPLILDNPNAIIPG